ncbi:MAG TPA: AAA family ATPase, partial [Bacteroidales bacterium]|nr:AAA family ATPase [Bacteroidales bacterium]
MYLVREIENDVRRALLNNPVVALIGPRQCGKSTLVKHIIQDIPDSIYLDLERPSDLLKLENSEWFLSTQRGK